MKLIIKLIEWFDDMLWKRAIKDVFENLDLYIENPEYYEEGEKT